MPYLLLCISGRTRRTEDRSMRLHNLAIRSLIVLVVTMKIALATTATSSSTPARFVDGDRSLRNMISFPDIPGDVMVIVYCVATIDRTGFMRENTCFESANVDEVFRDAITKVARSSEVTPAVVSGEPLRTYLWYRVAFVQRDGQNAIGVFPNWGHNAAEYGNDYEGPQRVTRNRYPSACRTPDDVGDTYQTNVLAKRDAYSFTALSSVTIGTDGKARSDVEVDATDFRGLKRCVDRITDILQHADYIPARHDGKEVEATYMETWGNYDAIRMD